MVIYCVFNTDLPGGSTDINGHISRGMTRMSEECGTSVLGFTLCWISSSNPDICLVLKFFPGLMLESKSLPVSLSPLSLPPTLSHHFTLLNFLSNPLAPSLPLLIIDVISQPGYQSKSLPNIFLCLLIPYQIYKQWSRNKTTLFIETLPPSPHCHHCTWTY